MRIGSTGLLATRFRGFRSTGRLPRLPVLRRQRRSARLRLPAVCRPERGSGQRRAALPAHRSGAHADRRRSAAFAACSSPASAAPGSATRSRHNPCAAETTDFRFLTNNDADLPGRPSATRPTRSATRHRDRIRLTGHASAGRQLRRAAGVAASGCRTAARRTGIGLETFALGFPIHFDWSWRTTVQQGLGERGLLVRERRCPTAPASAARKTSASRASRSGLATTSDRRTINAEHCGTRRSWHDKRDVLSGRGSGVHESQCTGHSGLSVRAPSSLDAPLETVTPST